MANVCMMSSIDNPFNPFEDFESWHLYEQEKGFDPCSIVARLANLSDDMSEEEIDLETERVIDRFIALDPLNRFEKVIKSVPQTHNQHIPNT